MSYDEYCKKGDSVPSLSGTHSLICSPLYPCTKNQLGHFFSFQHVVLNQTHEFYISGRSTAFKLLPAPTLEG